MATAPKTLRAPRRRTEPIGTALSQVHVVVGPPMGGGTRARESGHAVEEVCWLLEQWLAQRYPGTVWLARPRERIEPASGDAAAARDLVTGEPTPGDRANPFAPDRLAGVLPRVPSDDGAGH